MTIINFKLGSAKIPVYDIGAIAAGFYVGYSNSKGVAVQREGMMLYGPTAVAAAVTPLQIMAWKAIGNWLRSSTLAGIENGSLYLTKPHYTGTKRRINELDPVARAEVLKRIQENLEKMRKVTADMHYVAPTMKNTAVIGLETIIGYAAGRACGQLL